MTPPPPDPSSGLELAVRFVHRPCQAGIWVSVLLTCSNFLYSHHKVTRGSITIYELYGYTVTLLSVPKQWHSFLGAPGRRRRVSPERVYGRQHGNGARRRAVHEGRCHRAAQLRACGLPWLHGW